MRSKLKIKRGGRWLKPLSVLLALLAMCFVVASCGGDDSDSSDDQAATTAAESEGGTTAVKVGIQPVAESAALYLGIEQGFFEEEGIDVEPVPNPAGGAAILEQVMAGEMQIGFGQPTSLVLARSNGVDVKIIAPATIAGQDESDGAVRVIAGPKSGIKTPEDLAGKKVGINARNNILHLTLLSALDARGVDTDGIEFVEVAFPDMPAALEQGDVDAIFSVEPFATLAMGAGGTPMMNPYEEVQPGLSTADYFAMGDWIEENSEAVAGFRRAMEKSNQYVIDNPDEVLRIVPTYTELDADLLGKIRLPIAAPNMDEDDAYQAHIDLVEQFGDAGDSVSLDELIYR